MGNMPDKYFGSKSNCTSQISGATAKRNTGKRSLSKLIKLAHKQGKINLQKLS